MKKILLGLILLPLAMSASADIGGNLVANGSFEDGYSGWSVRAAAATNFTIATNHLDWGVTPENAPDGTHWGELFCQGYGECEPGHWAGTTIDQTLSTVAGTSYSISLQVGNVGTYSQSPVDIYWNGARVATNLADTYGSSHWTVFTISDVVGTGHDVLSIGTSAGAYGESAVDAVSVTSAVPEPQTYAMLLSGLVLVFGVSRRRRA